MLLDPRALCQAPGDYYYSPVFSILFTLINASGSPARGLSLVSDVWMPAHGHGSSEPVNTAESETADGLYIVSAFFTMPGEWEVLVDIDPNGADETLSFLVEAFTE